MVYLNNGCIVGFKYATIISFEKLVLDFNSKKIFFFLKILKDCRITFDRVMTDFHLEIDFWRCDNRDTGKAALPDALSIFANDG